MTNKKQEKCIAIISGLGFPISIDIINVPFSLETI
jgi:hypothetical protein